MDHKFISGLIEKIAGGGYRVLASTSAVDRQGDSIDQKGWELGNYLKNPVMLWAHDYDALPVAKANNVEVTAQGLVLSYEFAPPEGNPIAAQIKYLVDNGFLNAVSVGFIPKERNGNVITRSELLEVSFVPVPANQEALQLALSKGISKDVIEKFLTVKEEVSPAKPEEKGEVADEVDAEEAMNLKFANLDPVFKILGAFCDVYLEEETPVENFVPLLKETIVLLQGIIPADAPEGEAAQIASLAESLSKAMTADTAKSFIHKIGARHSKKTKEAISSAMTSALAVHDGLKALIDSGVLEDEAKDDGEDKTVNAPVTQPPAQEEKMSGAEELRALFKVRGMLRSEESTQRTALSVITTLIEARRS